VFKKFMDEHPGVKVEYITTPFGEIVQKTTAGVTAGVPVDASVNSILHGRDLWDRGALTELTPFIAKVPEMAPAKYFEVANFYRSSQGKFFGASIYVDSSLLCLNSRLVAEAGLDPKGANIKTWDDLLAACEKLTKREGGKITQVGFPYAVPSLEEFATWAYGNGAELHDREVTKAKLNDPKILEMVKHRTVQYQRFAVNWAEDMKDVHNAFKIGKVGYRHWSMGAQVLIKGGTYVPKDFQYWFTANPKGPSGDKSGVATWVNMVVMPKGVKDPDLAWELIRTVAGLWGQTQMFKLANLHPSLQDFYTSPDFTQGVKEQPVLEVAPKLAQIGKTYPFFRRFGDVNKDIAPLISDAITGKTDPVTALTEAEKRANVILEAK